MEKSHGIKGLILLLMLVSCSSPEIIFDSGASFNVEVADSPEEQAAGLMHRLNLPENEGMLFVFEDEKPRAFWMKNTLIPLDMIFMDSNLTVVDIKHAVPCSSEPCELYHSRPAQYVLEINKGLSEENKISVGSTVELNLN